MVWLAIDVKRASLFLKTWEYIKGSSIGSIIIIFLQEKQVSLRESVQMQKLSIYGQGNNLKGREMLMGRQLKDSKEKRMVPDEISHNFIDLSSYLLKMSFFSDEKTNKFTSEL